MNLRQDTPNLVSGSQIRQQRAQQVRLPKFEATASKPTLTDQEQILRRFQKQQYLMSSMYVFLTECLGFQNLDDPHKDLCAFMDDESNPYKLILMPRNTFKTSLITIGGTVYEIVKNPDSRSLINSELFKNSKKMLWAVKNYFEKSEVLRAVFGEYVPKRDEGKWNDTELVVSKKKSMAKESTVTAAGLDVEQTSAHYTRIVHDDLMSLNNTNSREQIDKVVNQFGLSFTLQDPTSRKMLVIGTRWHFADLYQHILDRNKFAVFKMGSFKDQGRTQLAFPTVLTRDFLDHQKAEMGSSHFANQYLNEPMDDESAKFKESWLKTYTEVPVGCHISTTIDPAISKDPTADETAIVTVAVDHERNWYVLEARHGRWDPYEITAQVFEVVSKFHPHKIGLEKVGFQQTLEYFMKQEMVHRNQYFTIQELKVDNRVSKERRIEGLIPLFEAGRVFLPNTKDDLSWQLRRYPKYAHDDIIDALSHQLQLVGVGNKHPDTKEVKADSLVAHHQRQQHREWYTKHFSFPLASRPNTYHVW